MIISPDVTLAILAGLGGMLGWGIADFFAKKSIDEIGDIVSLVWAHVAGSFVLLAFGGYAVATHSYAITLPTTALSWAGLSFFGALQGAVYLFVYMGFGKGQVSILNPVFASFSGFVALISIVFLGEAVTTFNVAALTVLFVGILLISVDLNALRAFRLQVVPGFREIAIATILATVWTLGWNMFVFAKDGLSFAIWMYLAMTAALLIYAAVRRIPLRFNNPKIGRFLFLIGLFEAVGYVAISLGYAGTSHTSLIALLSGGFSLPTLFLARLFLRERLLGTQIVGGLVIVGAVMLLALA